MAAVTALSTQFHGTGENFLSEGDVIEPRGGKAFATVDKSIAEKQAAIGHKKMEQGVLFGSVYEVEPIGGVTTSDVYPHQRISTGGFRVKKHVGFVPSDFSAPKFRRK